MTCTLDLLTLSHRSLRFFSPPTLFLFTFALVNFYSSVFMVTHPHSDTKPIQGILKFQILCFFSSEISTWLFLYIYFSEGIGFLDTQSICFGNVSKHTFHCQVSKSIAASCSSAVIPASGASRGWLSFPLRVTHIFFLVLFVYFPRVILDCFLGIMHLLLQGTGILLYSSEDCWHFIFASAGS